ncbi:Calcium release-activated calcium channel [Micractinium conductrix]|uniref:Uncharacterized protein ycf33 n=1 Tax=Micractinium conductrix TaxID=554055 RepID=A0A2P6V2U0_9CHLO|nr:Calcium release-activated calcium channel [Micractinium conductrix]|eukprot:PSC68395.1 Calcium release-activated calcium channel [Micractinium conductrix]
MATTGLGGATTGLGGTAAASPAVGAGTYARLTLTVKSAHNMKDKAWLGKSDPYCVIRLADAEIQTHHVKNAGEQCTWDESFAFNNVSPDDVIEFHVYDHNRILKDAHMGEGSLSLRQVFEEGRFEARVPLTTRTGTKDAGELWVSLRKEGGAEMGAGAGAMGGTTTGAGYQRTGEGYETERTGTGYGTERTGAGYGEGLATGGYAAGARGTYERREDEYAREAGLGATGYGATATPAMASTEMRTSTQAVTASADVPVARQGQPEVCSQEYFTKVEDRPVIKERVTRVREHHPVEKEFVVETRATGVERETGQREMEHMGAQDRVVEVAQPVVEQPTEEYFTKVEDRPVMKERVTRTREHHPVEKEFVVETRATGERETGERVQEHMGAHERVVEVAQPKGACDKAWRDEERAWRQADLAWRQEELAFMQQQAAWRAQDLEQRHLENARTLWMRAVEKNRRDVEERAEQLKAISNLSGLIAGFALAAFMQFDFSPDAATEGVQLAFGVTIALTVALESCSMVLCSLIHASILRIGRGYVSSQEEADFMARARQWVSSYKPGDRPPAPRRTFQAHWAYACERQWRVAFLFFTAGIPAFFANMALAAWIKFDYSHKTAAAMTAVLAVAFAYFLVAQNRWSWHLVGERSSELQEVLPPSAPGGLPWDWHHRPHGGPSITVERHASLRERPELDKPSSEPQQALEQQPSQRLSQFLMGEPRVLASCSLGDSGTLLLAAVLAGGLLLGVAEPALAAGGADGAHGVPQLLGDVAENEDFWGNVLRYISYFFSVLLGTAYIAIRPLIELMKRPGTAVLVVAGTAGLVYFVSFTVQTMLGMNDVIDYTARGI